MNLIMQNFSRLDSSLVQYEIKELESRSVYFCSSIVVTYKNGQVGSYIFTK